MAMKRAPHGRHRSQIRTPADGAAVRVRLAARLGALASLLHGLAQRAGDVRDELRQMRRNAIAEHERLILHRAASMLVRPILDLSEVATYVDRRGTPRAFSSAGWRFVQRRRPRRRR